MDAELSLDTFFSNPLWYFVIPLLFEPTWLFTPILIQVFHFNQKSATAVIFFFFTVI